MDKISCVIQFIYCSINPDELLFNCSPGNYEAGELFTFIDRSSSISQASLDH